jgi:UDP-N-acetylglucosamine--N-acetylmuramyl-(pentapeptide) pyrophosphoryl-undecaprenol N-acetylglucosamine transferase
MIHEQNAFLGRANHVLAKFANRLAISWPQTKNLPAKMTATLTGMPVRQAFFAAAHNKLNFGNATPLELVVLGGSQGAAILATLVPDAIAMLDDSLRQRLCIRQQARPEQIDSLTQRYTDLGVKADIKTFFTDVPNVLSSSHLVICRAGASSVAELAAIGRAALLLPLPSAMDDHQRMNAMQMQNVGGAICLDETNLSAASLATRLMQLLGAPKSLLKMANDAKTLANPDAADAIADLAENLVSITRSKQTGAAA